MKIMIWSDYVCPFCYIGSERLKKAIGEMDGLEEVVLDYRSFELDPARRREDREDVYGHLAKKYGITLDEARQNVRMVEEMAALEGLRIDNGRAIPANTFDAHRLGQLARKAGRSEEFTALLYAAHFTEGVDLNDHDSLLVLAERSGLDKGEARTVLEGTAFAEEVRQDEARAREIGIGGVPFFVINDRYAVSGAKSREMFLKVLMKAWEEEGNAST